MWQRKQALDSTIIELWEQRRNLIANSAVQIRDAAFGREPHLAVVTQIGDVFPDEYAKDIQTADLLPQPARVCIVVDYTPSDRDTSSQVGWGIDENLAWWMLTGLVHRRWTRWEKMLGEDKPRRSRVVTLYPAPTKFVGWAGHTEIEPLWPGPRWYVNEVFKDVLADLYRINSDLTHLQSKQALGRPWL